MSVEAVLARSIRCRLLLMTHRSRTAAALVLAGLSLAVGACAAPGSLGSPAADEAELMGNYALLELSSDGQSVQIPKDFSVTVMNVVDDTSFIDVLGLCTRVDITAADWPAWPTEGVLYTQQAEYMPTVGCADELGGPVTALREVLIGTVSLEMSADGSTVTLTQGEDQAVLERR